MDAMQGGNSNTVDSSGAFFEDYERIARELTILQRQLETKPGFLRQLANILADDDHVGLSFLLASGIMLAATAFFFFQIFLVPRRWANSMIICGLVTGVAWHHYMYMKEVWTDTGDAPTVYRYMDWLITVPLQVTEFYLVLVAANPVDREPIGYNLFFRLMFASLLMLTFGYMGETQVMEKWVAFTAGLFMWFYIIWEVYMGEASVISSRLSLVEARRVAALSNSPKSKTFSSGALRNATMAEIAEIQKVTNSEFKKPEAQLAFEVLRLILLIGWALYPIGYVAGNAGGKHEVDLLNGIYNIADLVNKVAFGLAIFYAASSQSELAKQMEQDAKLPDISTIVNRKLGASTIEIVTERLRKKLKAAHDRMDEGYRKNREAAAAAENNSSNKTSFGMNLTTGNMSMEQQQALQQNAMLMSGMTIGQDGFTPRGSMFVDGVKVGTNGNMNGNNNNPTNVPGMVPMATRTTGNSTPNIPAQVQVVSPQLQTDVHMRVIQ